VYPTGSKEEWIALVRTVEGLGYSTLQVADHLWGQFAIVPALVIAAEATQKLRNMLIGTLGQICEQVLALRQQYGISYLTVSQPQMKAFAPVIARLQ
jgi:hypothetical protein